MGSYHLDTARDRPGKLSETKRSRTQYNELLNMSYYRYITGVYKSFMPELNRTLRSSSVPRHVPQLDTARYTRSSSVPPSSSYSTRHAASPFMDRANSVPPRN